MSNFTGVTIEIMSKNVIPNVCHCRMLVDSKFDKKHLETDIESAIYLSHSLKSVYTNISVH